MEDYYPLLGLLAIILLVYIKAEISKAKAAISNVNETYIKKKAEEEKDKETILLASLIDKPENYIFAIDILITTISILCGYIYYAFLLDAVNQICSNIGLNQHVIKLFFQIIAIIILVIFVALFGSLIPKKMALRNTEEKAYRMVGLIAILIKLFKPMTIFLKKLINFFIKLGGINPEELNENVTEDEIISMVNEGHEQGVLEANEVEMISNIMEFDDKVVKDVMTHRKSIMAVDSSMKMEDALKLMLSESYSRYPVYEEDIDNIIGILHVKDVARYYVSNEDKEISLKKLMRKPYFVPETQNIDILLNDMQNNKTHMAIAIDEYGQTSGIVAFEDVLEEIVGNILDEYDVDEKNIIKQANGHYIIKGLTPLEDIGEVLNIEIDDSEYDTLNGFLISMLQRIPNDGEKLTINYNGYMFEILDVKSKMIKYVRVKKSRQ